jgi:hypothetical protein
MSNLSYFFDGQIRRYILQVMGVFTGIQWETGKQTDGQKYRKVVPVKWGAPERQVDHIIRNNSENSILSVPQISVWVSGIELDEENRRSPNFVDTLQVFERDVDPQTGMYTEELGNTYTVERLMPVPYKMRFQVDIWTSNQLQKDQLLEQILVLFNPSLDLQTSTNPLDWTAITVMKLTNITYSSRSVPIGTQDEIEIATLEFEVPIWITPPAKVKKQNIINQIVVNIGDLQKMPAIKDENIAGLYWDDNNLLARVIITPDNHRIAVEGNEITLLSEAGLEYDANGKTLVWQDLLNLHGELRPAISQIRLKSNNNLDDFVGDIVGTIQIHPLYPNKLLWTIDVDTLKGNTLIPIDAIINPQQVGPGIGLPIAQNGQRYLLDNDIFLKGEQHWNNLNGKKGDIIEYNNGSWYRVFIAETNKDVHYIINKFTGKQLKWDNEELEWILSIDGVYNPGYWRLFL